MYRLLEAMADHPLRSDDGREYADCRRIFHNGSLSCGGRIYGDWQVLSEDQRLQLKIDEEPVCEIDIKACFLSIVYSSFGNGILPPHDPYSSVRFVAECDDLERKQLRTACKLLVVAYLGKNGEMTRYPKGKKKKGEKRVIPFKQRHGLNKKFDFYMSQILEAHPVLLEQKASGEDLMFRESSIIIDAMLTLLGLGVVSYPVHDCLIVKLSHKEKAIEVLSNALREHLGFVPALDVAYLQDGQRVDATISMQAGRQTEARPQPNKFFLDWGESEDFDLIEDLEEVNFLPNELDSRPIDFRLLA